jgi:methyl farnesoate epoxidase/farnesoate epoxidase
MLTSGILWGRDEAHKEMRRFSIRTLRDFGFGKQTSQEAVIEDEVMELFSRLNSRLESEGNIICMQQFFNISVLNILWSMMAGVRFSHDDPEFKALVNMINQTMKLLGGNGNIFMAFPFLRHILPKLTGYGQVRTETLNHLRGIFFVSKAWTFGRGPSYCLILLKIFKF